VTERTPSAWSVERMAGAAADFHARPLPSGAERLVTVLAAARPALVLGSTQRDEVVDADAVAASGIDRVRRRSGGGAVLVDPATTVWIDVDLPVGDPLWTDDVGRSFGWLGHAWAEALGALGLDAAVNPGGMCTTPWSRLVCFAGLGPGEVTVGGVKAVGLAQRRTRHGARFQTAVNLAWDPAPLLGLLALDPAERARASADLRDAVVAVPGPAARVTAAFLAALP
jgi:lipoate-protein ligase A